MRARGGSSKIVNGTYWVDLFEALLTSVLRPDVGHTVRFCACADRERSVVWATRSVLTHAYLTARRAAGYIRRQV